MSVSGPPFAQSVTMTQQQLKLSAMIQETEALISFGNDAECNMMFSSLARFAKLTLSEMERRRAQQFGQIAPQSNLSEQASNHLAVNKEGDFETMKHVRANLAGSELQDQSFAWPDELPVIINRINNEPVEYHCQWRDMTKSVSVDLLVAVYHDKFVQLANKCDAENGVVFEAEDVEDMREGQYFVKWRGYPREFNTWEHANDERWEAQDPFGEKKAFLIEKWKARVNA
jgi:hypothetical protein